MAGVRIQHPTDKDTVFILVDGSRPYEQEYDCPACHKVHQFKTYHLKLDGVGATIVSQEIVDRLKAIPGQPFAIGEEIDNPPAQTVTVGPAGAR